MRKKTSQERVTQQIARAKSGKKTGGNSGIFSNSGMGQKVDNKLGPSAVHSYAKNPGAQKVVRRSLILNPGIKAPSKAGKKDVSDE